MPLNDLEERKKRVLQIIIEDYIDSAEPVGSKTVTQNHNIEASPATIRFDMADLEKKGYIKKPHTSAGRIPSDKGYRYFIDNIMGTEEISQQEALRIKQLVENLRKQQEAFIDTIGELLSALSGNTSVIVSGDKYKNITVSGISKMLRQPEFSAADKICDVVETLEKHDLLTTVLEEYINEDEELSIHVGSENTVAPLRHCSVAVMPYAENGIVCVVGPTRMDYGRTASVIRCFSRLLEE